MTLTRRKFLVGAGAGALGAAALPTARALAQVGRITTRTQTNVLPPPAQAGFDHVVVLCMENRSFDHLMGWLPGSNGRQAGLSYPDTSGQLHATYHLTTDQGCGHPDPDHSYQGARVEYDNGACDGWLKVNDPFSIGYYSRSDLAFTGRAAPAWTACDNYYAATLGPTFPNRMYLHSAQTDRTGDSFTPISTLPTIWDRLKAAGVSNTYYFSDLPFLALWGTRYLGISQTFAQFKLAAALGTLPAVSYVEPNLGLELVDGLSSDDHPHGDIRNGEAFMNLVYETIVTSPNWHRTVFVITFDEWGGFFDHVPPVTAPDTNPALTGLRGFRVPCMVFSPLAPRGAVAHGLYDHTSILKMIEWRWGLAPLTPRDAAANNLAEVLDFTRPPETAAPHWNVNFQVVLPCALTGTQPLGPGSKAAPAQAAPPSTTSEWQGLRQQAVAHGWAVGA
jgi:phospholipase C